MLQPVSTKSAAVGRMVTRTSETDEPVGPSSRSRNMGLNRFCTAIAPAHMGLACSSNGASTGVDSGGTASSTGGTSSAGASAGGATSSTGGASSGGAKPALGCTLGSLAVDYGTATAPA